MRRLCVLALALALSACAVVHKSSDGYKVDAITKGDVTLHVDLDAAKTVKRIGVGLPKADRGTSWTLEILDGPTRDYLFAERAEGGN